MQTKRSLHTGNNTMNTNMLMTSKWNFSIEIKHDANLRLKFGKWLKFGFILLHQRKPKGWWKQEWKNIGHFYVPRTFARSVYDHIDFHSFFKIRFVRNIHCRGVRTFSMTDEFYLSPSDLWHCWPSWIHMSWPENPPADRNSVTVRTRLIP